MYEGDPTVWYKMTPFSHLILFLLMCSQWLLLGTLFYIIQYNDDYCVLLCVP